MARKTPGIYIAIRGDYSAFATDLNHAKKMAQAQGDAIAKSIGNAVSKADLTGGINKLTRELKTAQAALSAGAFKGQVSGLEEIAKAAGVSRRECFRCFKELRGESPTVFLTQYRLSIAATQLATTGLPISAIAENCGFESSGYFSRLFKARYGKTPREFRK